MADFVPVAVTVSNYEEAINENIRRIFETLTTKVLDSDTETLLSSLDLNNNKLTNVRDAVSNFEPINKRQLDNGV